MVDLGIRDLHILEQTLPSVKPEMFSCNGNEESVTNNIKVPIKRHKDSTMAMAMTMTKMINHLMFEEILLDFVTIILVIIVLCHFM